MPDFLLNFFNSIKEFFLSLLRALISLLPPGELPYKNEIQASFDYVIGAMKALNIFLPISEILDLFLFFLYLEIAYVTILGLKWFINYLRGR